MFLHLLISHLGHYRKHHTIFRNRNTVASLSRITLTISLLKFWKIQLTFFGIFQVYYTYSLMRMLKCFSFSFSCSYIQRFMILELGNTYIMIVNLLKRNEVDFQIIKYLCKKLKTFLVDKQLSLKISAYNILVDYFSECNTNSLILYILSWLLFGEKSCN